MQWGQKGHTTDRKGDLEVMGLPEPTRLDHQDHRDLRAEGERGEGGEVRQGYRVFLETLALPD